jgi:hypothetical protein
MAQANHTSGRKTAPDYLSKISIQAVMEVVSETLRIAERLWAAEQSGGP